MMTKLGRIALVLCLTGPAAVPLAADWLVLRDGSRLETRGAWEQKGRLLVFTTRDGALVSLRVDEVDLDASRQATEEAARPAPAPQSPPAPAEPAEAVFVLTDADVTHEIEVAAEEDPDAALAETEAERLVVTDWQETPLPDESGTALTGTLRNVSSDAATRIRLAVLVYDANGELLATQDAMLSSHALMPDRQARFQVEFDGIYTIAAVTFRPTTLPIDTSVPDGELETEAELADDDLDVPEG
jgi:hypothetical protein